MVRKKQTPTNVVFKEKSECRCLHIKNSSDLYPVPFSFLLFLFVYFIFTCIGIPIYLIYFVCDSASEFGAMGSTSFLGFSYPNLLLVFLNLLFLGTCIICFSQVSVGLSLSLFYFILFFLYLILG